MGLGDATFPAECPPDPGSRQISWFIELEQRRRRQSHDPEIIALYLASIATIQVNIATYATELHKARFTQWKDHGKWFAHIDDEDLGESWNRFHDTMYAFKQSMMSEQAFAHAKETVAQSIWIRHGY